MQNKNQSATMKRERDRKEDVIVIDDSDDEGNNHNDYNEIEMEEEMSSLSITSHQITSHQEEAPVRLFAFQERGVEFLLQRDQGRGAILGDVMGLGKTIQIVAFIKRTFPLPRSPTLSSNDSILLVTPKSVMHQWVREFARVGYRLWIFYGTKRNFETLRDDYYKVARGDRTSLSLS